MYAYQNLTSPRNTSPGVAETVYIAPVKWFAPNGIKQPVAPFTAAGDEVTIKESHVFNDPALGFFKTLLAPEKNSYDAKVIGDIGFQNLEHQLKIFIPGSYAPEHEQIRHLVDVPLIALHKDGNCTENLWYQFGTDWLECYLTVDFSTSVTKDGVKGYAGVLSFISGQVQIYTGTIQEVSLLDTGDFNDDFSSDFLI